jgi:hypothetical protein
VRVVPLREVADPRRPHTFLCQRYSSAQPGGVHWILPA